MTGLQPVSFRKGRAHAPRLSAPRVPGQPRHGRFWTPEEDDFVRRLYPKGGAAAVALHLGDRRSHTSIYQRALTLGVDGRMARNGPRRRHVLTDDLKQRIVETWPSLTAKGARTRFAAELGIPKHVLFTHATRLGLTAVKIKEPAWTEAEEQLLRTIQLHDPKHAAIIFAQHGYRRTPTSIVVKAKRLEVSRRFNEGFSARAIASLFGVDSKTVTAWLIAGDIPATRRPTDRLPQQGGDPWVVTLEDLRRFIIDNIARIDIAKVDKGPFVDVLTADPGATPDIVKATRARDQRRAAGAPASASAPAMQVASEPGPEPSSAAVRNSAGVAMTSARRGGVACPVSGCGLKLAPRAADRVQRDLDCPWRVCAGGCGRTYLEAAS